MGNCVSDTEKVDLDANLSRVSLINSISYSNRNQKSLSLLREALTRLNLRKVTIITSVLVENLKINRFAMDLTKELHLSPCSSLGTRRPVMHTSAAAKDQRTSLYAMELTIIQLTGEKNAISLEGQSLLG